MSGHDEVRYKRPTKILKLRFDDPEFEGLVVKMRTISVDEMLDWKDAESIQDEIEKASAFLISWNLDDEAGGPVPCTAEGMRSQPKEWVTAVILAMWQAVVGVPAPLSQPSESGVPSPALSIPMEPLSENQPT